MLSNDAERLAVVDVLRAWGFSCAWVLTNTDMTEDLFLVEPTEFESVDYVAVVRELMRVLPHRKVGIAALGSTQNVARIY